MVRGQTEDMSQLNVYRLVDQTSNVSGSAQYCSEPFCSISRQLQWHGLGICALTVTCENFSSNICKNFGVTLRASKNQSLCYDHQVAKSVLRSGQTASLDIWWKNGTRWTGICHAWCSSGMVTNHFSLLFICDFLHSVKIECVGSSYFYPLNMWSCVKIEH